MTRRPGLVGRMVLIVAMVGVLGVVAGCRGAGDAPVGASAQAIVQPGGPSVSPTSASASPSDTVTASPTPGDTTTPQGSALDRFTSLAGATWWLWGLLGLAAGYLLGRASTTEPEGIPASEPPGRGHPMPDGPDGPPAPVGPEPAAATPRRPEIDRALVDDLVLGHDLAEDEAMADQLERVLEHLGVVPVPADAGTPFDSRVHRAVGTAAADPASGAPVILQVVRPGWRSPEGVVRQPEVIVARTPADRDVDMTLGPGR